MYESFFGLKEKPFSLLPDPEFLYMTRNHRLALTMLEYGMSSQAGFTVITGEIGAGKTTLIRKLLENDDPSVTVGLLNNTMVSDARELLCWICFAFGLEFEGKDQITLYNDFIHFLISEYGEGRRIVVIIDEAQQLGAELLEQVRMLSNINSGKHLLIQFILLGQPELRDILRKPELVQFAQRIAVDYHLKRLSQEETLDYIRYRISVAGGSPDLFSDDSARMIWRYSRGVPRLINVLCDTALVYAFSEQVKKIELHLVEEVIKDKEEGLAPVQEDLAMEKEQGELEALSERRAKPGKS
jgi:putative secretion ATPase (PEP-CTERM system associated)